MTRPSERIIQAVGLIAVLVIAAGVCEWRDARPGGPAGLKALVKPSTVGTRPAERSVFEQVCGEEFAPRLVLPGASTVAPVRSGGRVLSAQVSLVPQVRTLQLQARRMRPSACDSLRGR